jgi:hypothetical protein
MMAVELTTYRVPEDLVSPTSAKEYVVAFVVFYEQGFGVPLHQFLHSLLQYYRLCCKWLFPCSAIYPVGRLGS